MLRISWIEHKSNEEVLNMLKTSLQIMKRRKCEYFGHIIRRPNSIQRLLSGARVDGKEEGEGQEQCGWTISRPG